MEVITLNDIHHDLQVIVVGIGAIWSLLMIIWINKR